MNKFADIIIYTCFFVIACKGLFLGILEHNFIQWPAIALLSILAPIAFAKSLHLYFASENKTTKLLFQPLSYLCFYLSTLLLWLVMFYSSDSTYHNLDSIKRIYPASVFNALTDSKTEEERKLVAKALYSEYGAKLSYLKSDGAYGVYIPDAEAIDLYKEKEQIKKQANVLRPVIRDNTYYSFFVSIYSVLSFFLVFSFAMYFIQKRANNALKRTP